MRLAILTVSALALSGCSWFGGGHGTTHTAQAYGQNAVGCAGGAVGGYSAASYGYAAGGCGGGYYGAQQGVAAPTGFTGQGYGAQGYGAQGYGAQTYGAQTYGAQASAGSYASTMLGAGAPYGSAVAASGAYSQASAGAQYGGVSYGATSHAGGQYGSGVQTVVGAPIYVPQPYPAPYGVPQCTGVPCGGGAAVAVGGGMPFGLEFYGGTEFDVGGALKKGKAAGPADGGGGQAGGFDDISYSDAYDPAITLGAALGYDMSRNTTLLGSVEYSKASGGNKFDTGSFDPYNAGTTTPSGNPRDVEGQLTDLELWTVEAGFRQYVGQNPGFRPYVGVSGGATHNNDVTLTQTYADDGTVFNTQQAIESGWKPTAAALVGAEFAVGQRSAIGIETGVRWRDNMDVIVESEDRISIPVRLRGRVAF